MKFIPDSDPTKLDIPFFEDATTAKHGVEGHSTRQTLDQLKSKVRGAIGRLGGSVHAIQSGKFEGKPTRYGYVIDFSFNGHPGRITVAALPIQRYSETKKEQALKQALYTVWKILSAQYNLLMLSPGSMPLLPYLLGDGDQTIAETYQERYLLPDLAPSQRLLVEGEIVE